jgi:arylsulfatase A
MKKNFSGKSNFMIITMMSNNLNIFKFIFCFLICVISKPTNLTAQKPNIIFIMADDMGYTDLGCYGNPYNETPHLDSLAKHGIRFTQAYSASPVCSPSRASLLTGKHPARLQLTSHLGGNRKDAKSPIDPAKSIGGLPTSEITIAEKLKSLGYQTAMIGKWHVGDKEEETPWKQGFGFTRLIGKNGLDYYNYGIFEDSYKKTFLDNGKYYLTDRLTDYATEFIQKSKADNPFFMYLTYSAPHVLTVPRADKLGKYFWKYEKFESKYNPNYAAMIESIDDGVGAIIKLLKEKNLLENTIIIFTSDNGGVGLPELGPTPTTVEGLRKWKGHVYEGGIRIPLIINWKDKLSSNVLCQNQVVNTDFFNTFLEMLGQKTEDNLDSKSFYSSLQKPTENQARTDIFWHYPHFSNQLGRPAGAIRLNDWKLVKSYETNQVELYNLKEDVLEINNLAKKNKAKAKELHELLLKRLSETNAQMPIRK